MIGYLGLGSNVGDRESHLRAAVTGLREHGVDVDATSSTYETEPVGEVLEQPDFLNAAVRIGTELEPEELLDVCKAIEVEQVGVEVLQVREDTEVGEDDDGE